MNRFAILCCAAFLVGCSQSEEQAETQMPGTPMISLADVAGVWTVQALPEVGDSALVTYELVATDSTGGWTVTFPDGEPIPARVVAVDGDSIVVDLGPYESALRGGVMVSTRSVVRLQDGDLTGSFVAHYQTSEPDSVLRGRQRGTRKP